MTQLSADQRYTPLRCFLIATCAFSRLREQETVNNPIGGPEETRTLDFYLARVALSQLSYRPIYALPTALHSSGFLVSAASLNLFLFCLVGSLHPVSVGFAPTSTDYNSGALLLSYEIIAARICTWVSPFKGERFPTNLFAKRELRLI